MLSAALRDRSSTAIIVFVVVFNTTVGVVQQCRADRVMAELTRLAAPTALVERVGLLVAVPASRLVPGDRVVLAGATSCLPMPSSSGPTTWMSTRHR